MPTEDRSEFGDYLRRRRAAMSPPEPGGARTSRRKVPGLRRQEIAGIAGISVEYYTRLEQGRAPHPSREVLTALARAFELSAAERDHLFRLGGAVPAGPSSPGDVVRPGLLRLLRGLDATMPVTVHDGRLDLLARNEAAAELLGPLLGSGRPGCNIAYQAFTSPALPELLGEEGAALFSRLAAAEFRAALSRYPGDPYLRAVFAELTATSPAFREHWARGEVDAGRSAVKTVRHPVRGWTEFGVEVLHDPERDHWIMRYTSRTEDRPRRTPPAGNGDLGKCRSDE
ncbi:helix-turn-helix transcriptional regulator [Saccharopolyspora sp. NPDC047091]|uniref:helix-turn-helix transcriptional regulator n=1 Tax=Saccharopolyspora sp. NPDC047091 TaxID=3155924 RepID=UPI003403FF05